MSIASIICLSFLTTLVTSMSTLYVMGTASPVLAYGLIMLTILDCLITFIPQDETTKAKKLKLRRWIIRILVYLGMVFSFIFLDVLMYMQKA